MSLLRRLALLLALEGLLLIGVGIAYAVVGASSGADTLPIELAAAFAVLTGLILLALARATDRERSWARSPAIVLNVFPFPLGLTLLQAGLWWVAVPMVLLAGTTLYLWATPELRETFRERD
jgi:predicted outer membrane lipoprotein